MESLSQHYRDYLYHDDLDPEEERKLFQKGDEDSLLEIWDHHQKMALSIAKRFRGRHVSLDERFQEARTILWECINEFDHRRGKRLGTYYYPKCKYELQRFCDKYNLPVNVPDGLIPYAKQVVVLVDTLSIDRLSNEIPDHELTQHPQFQEIRRKSGVTAETLLSAYSVFKPRMSYDSVIDLVVVEYENSFEMEYVIDTYMKYLSEQDKSIFVLRYFQGETQEAVAKKMGLGVKTIRRRCLSSIITIRDYILSNRELFHRAQSRGYIDKNIVFTTG